MRQGVIAVHQSLLNPQRWLLRLECGHEMWMTSKTRPTRLFAKCDQCKEKEVK